MKILIGILIILMPTIVHSSQRAHLPPTVAAHAELIIRQLNNEAKTRARQAQAIAILGQLAQYEGADALRERLNQALANQSSFEQKEKEEKAQENNVMQDISSSEQSLVAPLVEEKIPETITIYAGRIGGAKREAITTTEIEAISGEPYAELIERQKQAGDPFLLARVLTRDKNNQEYLQYYDAHSFNQWRFGGYPYDNNLQVVHATDPKNRIRPDYSVQYFLYDPKSPQQGFSFMFSEEELLRGPSALFLRAWLSANQNYDATLKMDKLLDIATYCEDGKNIKKDLKKALSIFEQLANQNANPKAQAASWFLLGRMYLLGKGVNINYTTALQYLHKAENQDANPEVQAKAWFFLGNMYFDGQGVEKNYKTALDYYRKVANQNKNRRTQADAWAMLGKMYNYSNEIDLPAARDYLEKAVNQTVSPWAREQALPPLGQLYYNEGYASEEDLVKARHYFEQALRENIAASDRMSVLETLGEIYFHGLAIDADWTQASKYYLQALELDENANPETHAACASRLAKIYYEGLFGVEKNYATAEIYADQAGDQFSNTVAEDIGTSILGHIYYEGGYGVEKDYAKARDYFEELAEGGDDTAENLKRDAEEMLKKIDEETAKLEGSSGEKHSISQDENDPNKRQKRDDA